MKYILLKKKFPQPLKKVGSAHSCYNVWDGSGVRRPGQMADEAWKLSLLTCEMGMCGPGGF